jgi:uncharacterized membrane protein
MPRRRSKSQVVERTMPKRRCWDRRHRLHFETLEDRTMLTGSGTSGLASIVVGRVMSTGASAAPAYFVDQVQNHQVTITYTAYNEDADSETGVLLTTTLEPGLTVASASVPPDQTGQNLAWSLGTIGGFDRASVSVTINLPNPTVTQLDAGAQVFATLDAAAVSNATVPAILRSGTVDPSLLASTPDANTTDPYIQEEAAKLAYDPQQIFDYLHTQVGYNSYLGSVRGARGTRWSSAGNALDVASLGVALMRASGIPAQYVSGTLAPAQAQSLILSMFPISDQTIGYIPVGTPPADPANDSQLLSETESHYWFQFDAGRGMQDADPLMAGATVDQSFTTPTSTFTVVPDNLRAKLEVTLNAEIDIQAASALGLSNGLETTTVLDQTFNDVDLVGHPLTVGNLVSDQSGGGIIISTRTITYSPYIAIGDEANDPSQAEVIAGKPYQEVYTNFPLASQALTGLFLNMTLSGPGVTSQPYERTLVDRIGAAARQGLAPVSVNFSASGPAALTDDDLFTINALAGLQNPNPPVPLVNWLNQQRALYESENASGSGAASESSPLTQNYLIGQAWLEAINFLQLSDADTVQTAAAASVKAYFDQPRLIIVSSRVLIDSQDKTASLVMSFDLRRDTMRVLAFPGQNQHAVNAFNFVRGIDEGNLEDYAVTHGTLSGSPGGVDLSAAAIIQTAISQNIPLVTLGPADIRKLDGLAIPADAKALITTTLQAGYLVIVPSQSVTLGGKATVAWYQVNPTTSETIAVTEDGGHTSILELAVVNLSALLLGLGIGFAVDSVLFSNPNILNQPILKRVVGAGVGLGGGSAIYAGVAIGLGTVVVNGAILTGPVGVLVLGIGLALLIGALILLKDPAVVPFLVDLDSPPNVPTDVSSAAVAVASGQSAGPVDADFRTSTLAVSGSVSASWNSSATTAFQSDSITAQGATVRSASGTVLGTGDVGLSSTTPVATAVSGSATYNVQGTGRLSFFGPAESNLGVGADWDQYAASVTGSLSITVTTDALTLNGTPLSAGTYTISAASAMLSGTGPSTSPSFSGSVSVQANGDTLNLGPAISGSVTVGGKPLDDSEGATLTGYTGSLTVTVNGDQTDSMILNGSAANVLGVSGSPTSITTDQNTLVTLQANVQTSLTDTYTLTAQAPAGWTVHVDTSGKVMVTPAPGLQGGTYPIQILAHSTVDTDLVAQCVVDVTITPTQPGLTLTVATDPLLGTVPYQGAQVPTSFRATLKNTGPASDTYHLTVANVPAGFTLLDSGTSVTVPAGGTGILGLYLQPTGQIPAPGTQVSFTVTATSEANPAITQTQTETFTVPAIDGVAITANPTSANTTPAVPVVDTITVTNVGNVPENNVTLTAASTPGLTVSGLAPVSLEVGQSVDETITLTPLASTPLNSNLQTTLTAAYGPSSSPQTQTLLVSVRVAVDGADAIAGAADAAQKLGNAALGDRLSDLSVALTSLVQNPTSAVYMSQALADVDSIVVQLNADASLTAFVGPLTTARAALANASTPATLQAAVVQLGNALGSLNTALADEVNARFTFSIAPTSAVAEPNAPSVFNLDLLNNGGQATTYDLSVSGLPASVSAQFNTTSVTLQPGQQASPITLTPTETGSGASATGFTVTVTPEGAPELAQSLTGALTVRADLVDVVSAAASPAYTPAGGQVSVSARVLNAVNQARQALASYTVVNAANQVVFTSVVFPVSLGVQTSLVTVDLGTFDTTGLADGAYTVDVSLSDTNGDLISGASGSGSLLVGTPINASLTVTPTGLPAGNGIVTDSLKIDPNPANPGAGGGPLTLIGQVQTTAVGEDVALNGTLAYVAGTGGIDVVDVSDSTAPKVVNSFGQADVLTGGLAFVRISGTELIVGYQSLHNAGSMRLLIYSIAADPTNPTLLSKSTLSPAYVSAMFVQGNDLFLSTDGDSYAGTTLLSQFGDFVAVDISNPASPKVLTALSASTSPPSPNRTNEYSTVPLTSQVAYVAGTTSTGGVPSGQSTTPGEGRLLIVNTSNAAGPQLSTPVGQLLIPGTNRLLGLAVDGNRALVFGSSEGYDSLGHMQGNITLSVLDVSNPLDPVQLGTTLVTPNVNADQVGGATPVDLSQGMVLALGGGRFAVSGTLLNGKPIIELVDINDPNNLVTASVATPSVVYQMATANGMLDATSANGLSVYNIGSVGVTPVTASVTIPQGTGLSVVPGSFNVVPTQILTGTNSETLVWSLQASAPVTLSWETAVNGLQPSEARTVVEGGTVSFTSQGTTGTVLLPPAVVVGDQIIGLSPSTQSVSPGSSANYQVILTNPTSDAITYRLNVEGVPAPWITLAPSVTVAANTSINVPLTIKSDLSAPIGDDGFVVSASDAQGASSSVLGDLILQGQAAVPDNQAHGVVVVLTPPTATAGQGDPVPYVVQVTNTGSADETFSLSVSGLPNGVASTFGQSTVDIPPGVGNSRDIRLMLTPAIGSKLGVDLFQVTALSTTDAKNTSAVSGTLTVSGAGVVVAVNPTSAAPGGHLQATVTNTGNMKDTFHLALGGPAALVSTLAATQVTLDVGASQVISITTKAAAFAPAGPLDLSFVATSQINHSVQAEATATLNVPPTSAFTAQLSPAKQTLAKPGAASMNLTVNNTGTSSDSYEAMITSKNGPVTASLAGLDGLPTQAISLFYVPGLTAGQIPLQATLTGYGIGTVTIQVKSLTTGSTVSMLATVSSIATTTVIATKTQLSISPASSGSTGPITLRAVVTPTNNSGPTGVVTFVVDGKAVGQPVTLTRVDGQTEATLILPSLAPGSHAFQATYAGSTAFSPSASPVVPLTITAPPVKGPNVIGLVRIGYHALPTYYIVSFNQPLNPTAAENILNYRIVGPDGRAVPIISAHYDAVHHTVTLVPDHNLNLHWLYRLTIVGTGPHGITNLSGQPLDGAGPEQSGSIYSTILKASDLVLGTSVPGGPSQLVKLEAVIAQIEKTQAKQLARLQYSATSLAR